MKEEIENYFLKILPYHGLGHQLSFLDGWLASRRELDFDFAFGLLKVMRRIVFGDFLFLLIVFSSYFRFMRDVVVDLTN
jgi:hypothetical protein